MDSREYQALVEKVATAIVESALEKQAEADIPNSYAKFNTAYNYDEAMSSLKREMATKNINQKENLFKKLSKKIKNLKKGQKAALIASLLAAGAGGVGGGIYAYNKRKKEASEIDEETLYAILEKVASVYEEAQLMKQAAEETFEEAQLYEDAVTELLDELGIFDDEDYDEYDY